MCRFVGSIRAGVILLATVGSLALAASLASAEGSSQTSFVTPTPGPDGKIIYVVQDGDVLWTIAGLGGKSVEEIMALNGLQPGDYLTPGMQLLLGLGGPVLPTSAPETRPTATLVPPTPPPASGGGAHSLIMSN